LIEPYYQDDACTIYCGDCREVLPELGQVDLVLTDPPYGIQDRPITIGACNGKRRGGKRQGGTNIWHPPSTWDADIDPAWCAAVCAAAPVVTWFGSGRKRGEVEAAMTWPLRAEIVWAKDCHVGPPCPLAMRDERIWLFAQRGIQGRTFETTVWDEPIIPTWSHKWHKNEKPVRLMQRLLAWLPDGIVCDPFMGSGTTLRAAKDLGRKAIGIELEERYCEIAVRRLAQEVLAL